MKDDNGNIFPNRINIDKKTHNLVSVSYIGELYAVCGFKKDGTTLRNISELANPSEISLNELAKIVNDNFGDTNPQLVLDYLGKLRPKTNLANNVVFDELDNNRQNIEEQSEKVVDNISQRKSQENQEQDVNYSMTMTDAKRMLDRAWAYLRDSYVDEHIYSVDSFIEKYGDDAISDLAMITDNALWAI